MDSRFLAAELVRRNGPHSVPTITWGEDRARPASDAIVAAAVARELGLDNDWFEKRQQHTPESFARAVYLSSGEADCAIHFPDDHGLHAELAGLGYRSMFRGDECFGSDEALLTHAAVPLVNALAPMGRDAVYRGLLGDALFDRVADEQEAALGAMLGTLRSSSPTSRRGELWYAVGLRRFLGGYNRVKQTDLDVVAPLLDRALLERVHATPDRLRTHKALLQAALDRRFPTIAAMPYATDDNLPRWDARVATDPTLARVLLARCERPRLAATRSGPGTGSSTRSGTSRPRRSGEAAHHLAPAQATRAGVRSRCEPVDRRACGPPSGAPGQVASPASSPSSGGSPRTSRGTCGSHASRCSTTCSPGRRRRRDAHDALHGKRRLMGGRVLRIITRLTVSGPSTHVLLLDRGLAHQGWETLLVYGSVEEGETEMDLSAVDVPARHLAPLRRSIRPADDARALGSLARLMRSYRPDIVHTHQSKAGLLGRLAGTMTRVPNRVHTFHGTVFEGYFSPRTSAVVMTAERLAARATTCTIVLSDEQRRELAERKIGRRDRVRVIPLGLELERFVGHDRDGGPGGARPRRGRAS